MKRIKMTFVELFENYIFQSIMIVTLFIPVLATFFQYVDSKYIKQKRSVNTILAWSKLGINN